MIIHAPSDSRSMPQGLRWYEGCSEKPLPARVLGDSRHASWQAEASGGKRLTRTASWVACCCMRMPACSRPRPWGRVPILRPVILSYCTRHAVPGCRPPAPQPAPPEGAGDRSGSQRPLGKPFWGSETPYLRMSCLGCWRQPLWHLEHCSGPCHSSIARRFLEAASPCPTPTPDKPRSNWSSGLREIGFERIAADSGSPSCKQLPIALKTCPLPLGTERFLPGWFVCCQDQKAEQIANLRKRHQLQSTDSARKLVPKFSARTIGFNGLISMLTSIKLKLMKHTMHLNQRAGRRMLHKESWNHPHQRLGTAQTLTLRASGPFFIPSSSRIWLGNFLAAVVENTVHVGRHVQTVGMLQFGGQLSGVCASIVHGPKLEFLQHLVHQTALSPFRAKAVTRHLLLFDKLGCNRSGLVCFDEILDVGGALNVLIHVFGALGTAQVENCLGTRALAHAQLALHWQHALVRARLQENQKGIFVHNLSTSPDIGTLLFNIRVVKTIRILRANRPLRNHLIFHFRISRLHRWQWTNISFLWRNHPRFHDLFESSHIEPMFPQHFATNPACLWNLGGVWRQQMDQQLSPPFHRTLHRASAYCCSAVQMKPIMGMHLQFGHVCSSNLKFFFQSPALFGGFDNLRVLLDCLWFPSFLLSLLPFLWFDILLECAWDGWKARPHNQYN